MLSFLKSLLWHKVYLIYYFLEEYFRDLLFKLSLKYLCITSNKNNIFKEFDFNISFCPETITNKSFLWCSGIELYSIVFFVVKKYYDKDDWVKFNSPFHFLLYQIFIWVSFRSRSIIWITQRVLPLFEKVVQYSKSKKNLK